MSRCLQMDVGNSGAKWRLVSASGVSVRGRFDLDRKESLQALIDIAPPPDEIWVASVAGGEAEARLRQILQGLWGVEPWFARTPAQCLGLVNSYQEPQRMGVDRWLAMLGAWHPKRGRVCVVDTGSALTIDMVDAAGRHEGGYILPGPALMERALLRDTDRVRFAENASYRLPPGKSTAEAVRHGVALAQAGAVRLALQEADISADQLLICGGGGETLHRLLGGEGRLEPDLVYEGLALMANAQLGCDAPAT